MGQKKKNHKIKFSPIWAGRWKKFRLFGIWCIKFSNDNEIIINLPHWVWHDAENVCSSTKNWTHPVDQSGDFACHDDANCIKYHNNIMHTISDCYCLYTSCHKVKVLTFINPMEMSWNMWLSLVLLNTVWCPKSCCSQPAWACAVHTHTAEMIHVVHELPKYQSTHQPATWKKMMWAKRATKNHGLTLKYPYRFNIGFHDNCNIGAFQGSSGNNSTGHKKFPTIEGIIPVTKTLSQ